MTDIMVDKTMGDFDDWKDPEGSYLIFRSNPDGDGTFFCAEIIHSEGCSVPSSHIFLPHTCLDAYIYGLQDLQQKLELQRIRHGKD